jgi:AAHS family 4-hydroxybenzoate transporter-like MFS transporter
MGGIVMANVNQIRGVAVGAASKVRPRVVAFICFIIVMIDGYDTVMPSFTAPLVAKTFSLGMRDIGNLFAIGYVGTILGALVAGQLSDHVGRRSVMAAALTISGIATLAGAAAPTFGVLLALRFVAGVGLGGAIPPLLSLTAEHAPAEHRNSAVVTMYIGYPLGAVAGGLITSFFLEFGWEGIFIGGGVAALVMALLALAVPETLRASAAVAAAGPGSSSTALSRIGAQFGEGRLGAALMMWIGVFSMLLMTYLLVSWIPTMAARSGLPLQSAALSGVVLNLGGVVGAVVLGPIVDRRGPFAPAAVMIGVCTVLIVLLGHSFGSVPLLTTVLFLVGFTGLGGQLICPAMTVDLFPVHVRGTGTGWVFGVGRLGSIVGPIIGGAMLAANLAPDRLFDIVAVSAAVAAISFAIAGRIRPGSGQLARHG